MNELVAKHKDIQTKILEFIDNECNNEDDAASFFDYLTKMDLNIYEVNLILHFLSIISDNHHRNIYFFVKIKQIIEFYKKTIKENISSSQISQIFRKSKPLLLYFYKEKIIKIEDLVEHSHKYGISDFFYPEIESNIFELIKSKAVFEIINANINFYLFKNCIEMSDYPLLESFLYVKVNQDFNSIVFNKIKSFLENSIDNKIKELSHFFIDNSSRAKIQRKKRENFGNFDILIRSFQYKSFNSIFEIFYSKLLVLNGNLNNDRNSNSDEISDRKNMYDYDNLNEYSKSIINKCLKNEKYIYKLFFNYIKTIFLKEGNKYINLYIEIIKFFKYVLNPVLKIVFSIKFENKDEKQNKSCENDDINEISDDSDLNDGDINVLNEENDEAENNFEEDDDEAERYEDNLLYQKMYPKIKKFLDDVMFKENTIDEVKYQQIS